MGWNCPECGRVLHPIGIAASLLAEGIALQVRVYGCDTCRGRWVCVYRPGAQDDRDTYVGLVKLQKEG